MERPGHTSYGEYGRTKARVAFLLLLDTSRPLPLVAAGFAIFGLVFGAALILSPQPWQGACYEASVQWENGNKRFGQSFVCISRIPYAIGTKVPAGETAATILGR
jgi:hypothetical protein